MLYLLLLSVKENYQHEILDWIGDSKVMMILASRREKLGEPRGNMFRALNRIVEEHLEVKAVYTIHMNQKVREIAYSILGKSKNVKIIEP